jgi:nitric oxide dioxygenase
MLSEKSARTVRATLPAVGGAIGEITPRFYDRLFAAHPALLRDLFNRGNQANGAQRQALGAAIVAFATATVSNPDVRPDAMLTRIAHKHASLGITPGQYRIVHQHLFEAIAEVLGDSLTAEAAAAWDEVYWLLANALIAIENRLYDSTGVLLGDTWRDYRVTGRHAETADVATFTVEPADGAPLPPARPGQFVSVQVQLTDGARQIRQYSLCGRGQFAVKRAGEVSGHLHDRVRPGDTLRVSAPFGDVTLDDGCGPLLLASAGIGCTPMTGMLAHLAAVGSPRRIITVHADRSQATHAFRANLEQLTRKLDDACAHVFYECPDGDWPPDRIGLADLSGIAIAADTTAYLCGPLPFMRAVRTQLLERGVGAADIHYEVFGPDLWLA